MKKTSCNTKSHPLTWSVSRSFPLSIACSAIPIRTHAHARARRLLIHENASIHLQEQKERRVGTGVSLSLSLCMCVHISRTKYKMLHRLPPLTSLSPHASFVLKGALEKNVDDRAVRRNLPLTACLSPASKHTKNTHNSYQNSPLRLRPIPIKPSTKKQIITK